MRSSAACAASAHSRYAERQRLKSSHLIHACIRYRPFTHCFIVNSFLVRIRSEMVRSFTIHSLEFTPFTGGVCYTATRLAVAGIDEWGRSYFGRGPRRGSPFPRGTLPARRPRHLQVRTSTSHP